MLVHFGFMHLGSLFFHRSAQPPVIRPPFGEVSLSGILWWGIPWLVLNARFGGYTAFILAGRGRKGEKETA